MEAFGLIMGWSLRLLFICFPFAVLGFWKFCEIAVWIVTHVHIKVN